MKPVFNYIITIHNKENLIETVLNAVIKCCHENSYIYPVLDGCSDRSEEIVDKIISKNLNIPIAKIKLNDVHEILSINEGLKQSNQLTPGYNIILQDDVILLDYDIEKKISKLYKTAGCKLGYLSFRLGANLKTNIFDSVDGSPFTDYIESAYGHGIDNGSILLPGQLAFRSISIKSPVCIPTSIINQFGLLDEKLAPCFHDDTEYCLRLLKHGYKNGVFAIKYQSEIEWGGTRKKAGQSLYKTISQNMDYIKDKYHNDILNIIATGQQKNVVTIEEFTDLIERKMATNQYKINNKNRRKFALRGISASQKIKYYLTTMLKKFQG